MVRDIPTLAAGHLGDARKDVTRVDRNSSFDAPAVKAFVVPLDFSSTHKA